MFMNQALNSVSSWASLGISYYWADYHQFVPKARQQIKGQKAYPAAFVQALERGEGVESILLEELIVVSRVTIGVEEVLR